MAQQGYRTTKIFAIFQASFVIFLGRSPRSDNERVGSLEAISWNCSNLSTMLNSPFAIGSSVVPSTIPLDARSKICTVLQAGLCTLQSRVRQALLQYLMLRKADQRTGFGLNFMHFMQAEPFSASLVGRSDATISFVEHSLLFYYDAISMIMIYLKIFLT